MSVIKSSSTKSQTYRKMQLKFSCENKENTDVNIEKKKENKIVNDYDDDDLINPVKRRLRYRIRRIPLKPKQIEKKNESYI